MLFDTAFSIDKKNALPRYAQVQRILRDLVASGKLRTGDKIPAEVHIADALGVSKMTVNKAIVALTADGLFVREVGRGTFVAPGDSHRESVLRPTIALSFVEGARDVLGSDYYSGLYRGMVAVLHTHHIEIPLGSLGTDDYLGDDKRSPAEGRLIIAPRASSIPAIEALSAAGRAVVVVGASWAEMSVPCVDSDNRGGAFDAVQHLIGLGHQRIALLYAEEETANTQDRIAGYRDALIHAGIAHDSACEVRAHVAWQAGLNAKLQLTQLLTGPHPVTAIFAAGHYLALEANNVVRAAGLSVPQDVSLVGYDDPISAQLVYPPLTTVRQPLDAMGRRAAEKVLQRVHGESGGPSREVLPARLVVRESTAPLRAAFSVAQAQ